MIAGVTKLINDTQAFLPRVPEVLLAFVVGYIVIQILIWSLVRGLALFRLPKALILIIKSMISVILWIVLFSHLLRMLGLSQVAITLSGSLLVIGLAIANGANTLVSDVIAGLFLAKDPDFDVGFRVKIADMDGVVESIDIRKIRIRTSKGTLVVVPNGNLDKERWEVIDRPIGKLKRYPKSNVIAQSSNQNKEVS